MRHALLALGLGLSACYSAPPRATALDAQRGNVELAELQQGRALMVTKCGNCHRPPMPSEHPAALWPEKLDEMASRANLDGRQRRLIQQYFVVMAQR
jgi:hypothetical protein